MRHLFLALTLALATAGCAADDPTTPTGNGGKTDNGGGDDSRVCVGVRGNGGRIWSHFGALARIHEHYGLIGGIAGGSSGSITSFLTESMYLNQYAYDCGDACSEDETARRIALMFKTLPAYMEVLAGTPEAQAIGQLVALASAVGAEEANIDALLTEDNLDGARSALLALLDSDEIKDLVNPELIGLITNSPSPSYHLNDIWSALKGFGSFSADSDLILLRPGVISFEAFAEKIGRIGSFYAAYGPADGERWGTFFSECARGEDRGAFWPQIAALPVSSGGTCGELFAGMLTAYRDAFVADEANIASRIDDEIGVIVPALISTSVLTGEAVTAWQAARTAYLAGTPEALSVNFDDVRFGYWGPTEELAAAEGNPNAYTDDRTARFLSLGPATWRTALSLSPAEPGLTRALEIADTPYVSAGGWSDLSPAPVLKNMGCDTVLMVMRQGEVDGGFASSVAALLGMDEDARAALYDLAGDSAIKHALETADGVWCTNWDAFGDADVAEIFADGYLAPMLATNARLTEGDDAYPNIDAGLSLPACTPGVAAP